MFNPIENIKEFHEKFNLTYNGPPRDLPKDLGDFRSSFLMEEAEEYEEATDDEDRARQLDALVDIVYVALGTSYMQGFNFEEAWRRVHEANMKKVRAVHRDQSTRDSTHDVVKPPGWVKPDLEDLVL